MKNICPACSSNKIIPDVTIVDQGQYSNGRLYLSIAGQPDALFFKDKQKSNLKAYICGDCGHTQLKVDDPEALYKKYLQSKKN